MRIWRKQEDGALVDAAIEPKDLVFVYGEDETLPLNCPLAGVLAPRAADYVVHDESGWYFAHDTGSSGQFNIKDLVRINAHWAA